MAKIARSVSEGVLKSAVKPTLAHAFRSCAIRGLKLSSPQGGLGNQPRASEQRERRPGNTKRLNDVP